MTRPSRSETARTNSVGSASPGIHRRRSIVCSERKSIGACSSSSETGIRQRRCEATVASFSTQWLCTERRDQITIAAGMREHFLDPAAVIVAADQIVVPPDVDAQPDQLLGEG